MGLDDRARECADSGEPEAVLRSSLIRGAGSESEDVGKRFSVTRDQLLMMILELHKAFFENRLGPAEKLTDVRSGPPLGLVV